MAMMMAMMVNVDGRRGVNRRPCFWAAFSRLTFHLLCYSRVITSIITCYTLLKLVIILQKENYVLVEILQLHDVFRHSK